MEKVSVSDMEYLEREAVNALTSDDKYSVLNRDNLRQPIHMHLSQQ